MSENFTLQSGDLKAIFCPDKGMNFVSYKKGEVEVIAQSTWSLFEKRLAGLGAIIGPHFHHRPKDEISYIPDESMFPHLKFVAAGQEPFSHGIGRYVPWKINSVTSSKIVAKLSGKDIYKGIELEKLEGQNFIMEYQAEMTPSGLMLNLSVESDKPSVVGFHTYYACKKGKVLAQVEKRFRGEFRDLNIIDNNLDFDLSKDCDLGFFPYPASQGGEIQLQTETHTVTVNYDAHQGEHSWQLWRTSKIPEGSSFVCIEPLSAKNPRAASLTKSKLTVFIAIGEYDD